MPGDKWTLKRTFEPIHHNEADTQCSRQRQNLLDSLCITWDRLLQQCASLVCVLVPVLPTQTHVSCHMLVLQGLSTVPNCSTGYHRNLVMLNVFLGYQSM